MFYALALCERLVKLCAAWMYVLNLAVFAKLNVDNTL